MGPARADEKVRDDVIEELSWGVLVDDSRIDVEVADGVATLAGTVDSYARKLAAQEAAHTVSGVRDVVNAIDVRPAADSCPTDRELEEMARRVLVWDALVPDRDLDVRVVDGWVTLSGQVSSSASAARPSRDPASRRGARRLERHRGPSTRSHARRCAARHRGRVAETSRPPCGAHRHHR